MQRHPQNDDHIVNCADCQGRWALTALDVDLDRVWTGVAAEVWARHAGPVERLVGRLLRSPGLARALVTTPSLVLSWVLASAAVLAIGVVLTHSSDTPWVALLAPALAGASIAYAYGPGVDPAFELSQTMPVSDRMILLVRGLAVFGLNAVLGLIASLFTAEVSSITLIWLVPMTAVCALALAAATLARSANVGVVAALGGWAIMVLGAAALSASQTTMQLGLALGAAVSDVRLLPFYLACAAGCMALTFWATTGKRIATIGGELPWR
jgi:hypothetical protein